MLLMFFSDPLAHIVFLSEYLSYGYNALLNPPNHLFIQGQNARFMPKVEH